MAYLNCGPGLARAVKSGCEAPFYFLGFSLGKALAFLA
jgi:surfactin synthase thioesterase subunit